MGVNHSTTLTGTNNPAFQASKDAFNADHTLTGQGGVPSGTSFPGSPSTNDLYYRTDRALLYYYDGTRWLTTNLLTQDMSIAHGSSFTSAQDIWLPVDDAFDIYITKCVVHLFSSGLTGSAYWTYTLNKMNNVATDTSLGTYTNQSLSNSTWTRGVITVNAVVDHSANPVLHATLTKTSTPNGCYAMAQLYYRLVG